MVIVLEFISTMVVSRFCRACACEINEACKIQNNPAKSELPLLLKRYVPEFDIKVENACLCFDCVSILYNFHNFKRKCLRTEENLRLHIRKHPELTTANLNNIFTPKEQTNNGLSLETNATVEETFEPPFATVATAIPKEPINGEITEPTFRTVSTNVEKTKGFTCEICFRVFSWQQTLQTHRREYHGRIRYQCSKCSRDFVYKKHYAKHLEYHTRPDASFYVCKICNFVYTSFVALNYHNISKHSTDDQKPFKCEVCAKRFIGSYSLTEHMRTHTGEKFYKYKCSMCKFDTKMKSRLDTHMIAKHDHVRNYKIPHAGGYVGKIKAIRQGGGAT